MKKILIISLLIFIILISFFNTSYATAITVTEENLEKVLLELQTDSSEDSADMASMKIDKEHNKFDILIDDNSYSIIYDLASKPTFTLNLVYTNDMTKDEWDFEASKMSSLMIPFVLVAKSAGIEEYDSMTYMLSVLFKNSGVSGYPNVDNAIDYAKEMYDNSHYPINDDLYTWSIKKISETKKEYKLQAILEINNNADFSKIKSNNNSFISTDSNIPTKDNADYVITLKVGQKCQFTPKELINSYSSSDVECIDFSDDFSEITALKPGISKGYIGINNTFKSFFITVEENTENKTLEPIIIKISAESANNNTTNTSNSIKAPEEVVNQVTNSISKLPQTGNFFDLKDGLILLCITASILLIAIIVKDIKYKNVNKK